MTIPSVHLIRPAECLEINSPDFITQQVGNYLRCFSEFMHNPEQSQWNLTFPNPTACCLCTLSIVIVPACLSCECSTNPPLTLYCVCFLMISFFFFFSYQDRIGPKAPRSQKQTTVILDRAKQWLFKKATRNCPTQIKFFMLVLLLDWTEAN